MSRKYILIDTQKSDSRAISLYTGRENVQAVGGGSKSSLLGSLKMFLDSNVKIDGVYVKNGPGEFSAVRQGVVIANTLCWAIGVGCCGLRKRDLPKPKDRFGAKLIAPIYSRPPNITKQKRK